MTPKIVCVAGPTACGKTTLGVLLAQRFHGEVVSADSMQIYRGMTVGTAAPTEAEMQGVPHHMIAVADPSEQWSAAEYVAKATPIVDDILFRGKLPILVGGTGLYLDALVRGTDFAAGSHGGAIRQQLQQRMERQGAAAQQPAQKNIARNGGQAAPLHEPTSARGRERAPRRRRARLAPALTSSKIRPATKREL